MNNPYTITFGKEPQQQIPRIVQSTEILQSFREEKPSKQVYMITGVRGSGKTVFMSGIAKALKADKDWIVVDLTPDEDMLIELLAALSSESKLAEIFKAAKINLSFWGFGLQIDGTTPITSTKVALTQMLEALKKQNKRVLITVDEAVSNAQMKQFASAYQSFVRADLPVFLLMTGLYENINELQNEKTLTFLYRTPRIDLQPLSLAMIARNYQTVFEIDAGEATEMADKTKGYPFAFQVLGYFSWEDRGHPNVIDEEYQQYLFEFVYQKMWAELSPKDRVVAGGIAKSKEGKVSEVKEILSMDQYDFNPYRNRLIKKGIIEGKTWGEVHFTLPLFKEFVQEQMQE